MTSSPLRRVLGSIQMTVQIDVGLPGATMVTGFVSAVTVGQRAQPGPGRPGDGAVAAPTTWPGTGEAGDILIRPVQAQGSLGLPQRVPPCLAIQPPA